MPSLAYKNKPEDFVRLGICPECGSRLVGVIHQKGGAAALVMECSSHGTPDTVLRQVLAPLVADEKSEEQAATERQMLADNNISPTLIGNQKVKRRKHEQ